MAADKYRHAEDEYFKLRGQFDTGRLTQEQFDEKLRALMIQDEQGRYWMLGADSGKWYFYDGAKWVQGEPYTAAAGASLAAATVVPASAPPAATAPPPPVRERRLPLAPLLILLALIGLGIAAFMIFQNRERIFGAPPPTVVVILPPTITRAPSPTALAMAPTVGLGTLPPLPTVIPATQAPTNPPPTLEPTKPLATTAPPVTVIVVTGAPPPTVALPTLLPTVTSVPTLPPTVAPTRLPPAATNVLPTNTPLPNCPAGVCVSKIEYAPASPKRNQDVTFTATFLNSTKGAQNYNWLILLYDPEKPGNNKGFGESPATQISIPPGESKFSVTYIPVNGPGGCKNLYMRAGWKVNAFDKPLFASPSGEPVTVFFDVCP